MFEKNKLMAKERYIATWPAFIMHLTFYLLCKLLRSDMPHNVDSISLMWLCAYIMLMVGCGCFYFL